MQSRKHKLIGRSGRPVSIATKAGQVEGVCDPKFSGVLDAFVTNFESRGEVGASGAIIVEGETLVDLWGGRKAPEGEPSFTMSWTVGEIVHRAANKRMGKFFADEIARPLGLDCWIGLPEEQEHRVAPMLPAAPTPESLQSRFAVKARTDTTSPAHLFLRDFLTFEANTRECRAAEIGAGNGVCLIDKGLAAVVEEEAQAHLVVAEAHAGFGAGKADRAAGADMAEGCVRDQTARAVDAGEAAVVHRLHVAEGEARRDDERHVLVGRAGDAPHAGERVFAHDAGAVERTPTGKRRVQGVRLPLERQRCVDRIATQILSPTGRPQGGAFSVDSIVGGK